MSAFIDAMACDGSRIAIAAEGYESVPLWGSALIVDRSSGVLSAERRGLSFGPADQVALAHKVNGLTPVDEVGLISRSRIPERNGDSPVGMLPPETHVGLSNGKYFTAYALFYRPFNQLQDVENHFASLGLAEADIGLTCGPQFSVLYQYYQAAMPVGALRLTKPQGTPSESYQEYSAGKVWQQSEGQRQRIVLENSTIRIEMMPWWDPRNSKQPDPAAADPVLEFLSRVSSANWA